MTLERNYVVGVAGYLNVVNIITIDNNINVRSVLTLVLVETEQSYKYKTSGILLQLVLIVSSLCL
jgi:hypothetical protein